MLELPWKCGPSRAAYALVALDVAPQLKLA
jgi:hypothetical protein